MHRLLMRHQAVIHTGVLATLTLALLIGGLAGCAGRASVGAAAGAPATVPPETVPPATVPAGDPLVYPGSTPLEISEEGQENYLGITIECFALIPVRIPLGTPATFAYTRDDSVRVEAYYSAALSSTGWVLARDGYAMHSYAGVWRRGQTNLVMVIVPILPSMLTWYVDTFDMHLPDADVVTVATYVWEAE